MHIFLGTWHAVFQWGLGESCASVVRAFSPVSLVSGDVNLMPFQNTKPLHRQDSAKKRHLFLRLCAFPVGFHCNLHLSQLSVFWQLERIRLQWWYIPSPVYVRWCESDWVQKIFEIFSPSAANARFQLIFRSMRPVVYHSNCGWTRRLLKLPCCWVDIHTAVVYVNSTYPQSLQSPWGLPQLWVPGLTSKHVFG